MVTMETQGIKQCEGGQEKKAKSKSALSDRGPVVHFNSIR